MSVQAPAIEDGIAALRHGGLLDALPDVSTGRAARRSRESTIRRLLVMTDVAALAVAFMVIELLGGFRDGHLIARDSADGLRRHFGVDRLTDVYVKAMTA